MSKIKPLMVLCVMGMLLGSGCASVRVLTDLKPQTDPKLQSAAGMFYIVGLKYCEDGPGQGRHIGGDVAYGKNLLLILRKECTARYPLLFKEDEKLAIPLYVILTDTVYIQQNRRTAWALCTLLITPFILPLPSVVDHDLTVCVSAWNGTDGSGNAADQKKFHREVHAWETFFTPLGLITIPGESDFPKESAAFDVAPVVMRWSYDYKQVAQQMATVLAEIVAAKEVDFWKTPLRPAQQSGPSQVTPEATPVSPPLPIEPVAPF